MTGIVVLGMHRSGTSALAGALQRLGFNPGEAQMVPNAYNEKGYFEDVNVVGFTEALLQRLGRSWSDIRPLPPAWEQQEIASTARQEGATVLRQAYDLAAPWVLKDPRIGRVLPLWRQIFSDLNLQPAYLISLRHPWAVIRSLQQRENMSAQRACALYVVHLLDAELNTRGCPRAVVAYADVLGDWRETLRRTFQTLGAAQLPVSDTAALAIEAFLDPQLDHDRGSAAQRCVAEQSLGLAATLASEIHELLSRAEPFSDPHRFDALREALCQHLEGLDPWLEETALAQRQCDEAIGRREQVMRFLWQGGMHSDPEIEQSFGEGALSVVYWRGPADEEYCEQRAVRVALAFSGEQRLRFELPRDCQAGVQALRWDISDRPAGCEVHEAWVEDPQGHRLWCWDRNDDLFAHASADMRIVGRSAPGEGIRVFASGWDPYAALLLPDEVVQAMQPGWAFVAVASVRLPTAALQWLGSPVEVAASVVSPSVAQLRAELEEITGTLQSALADWDETAVRQRQQLEQIQLRAERVRAQLALPESPPANSQGPGDIAP